MEKLSESGWTRAQLEEQLERLKSRLAEEQAQVRRTGRLIDAVKEEMGTLPVSCAQAAVRTGA
jgi:hypothetical protein